MNKAYTENAMFMEVGGVFAMEVMSEDSFSSANEQNPVI